MQIYHYNQDGIYLGDSAADPSPLEPGVFLIPANATGTKPPSFKDGYLRRFVNGIWEEQYIEPIPEVVTPIEPIPEVVTPIEPEPLPVLSCSPWQIRKKLNKEGLRSAVESYVASEVATQDEKDAWEFATEFREDNPLLVNAASMLGIPDIHAFIEDAQTL